MKENEINTNTIDEEINCQFESHYNQPDKNGMEEGARLQSSTPIRAEFGRLDDENESDKEWEILYASKQRVLRNKRKKKWLTVFIAVLAVAVILITGSYVKDKQERERLDAEKQEYLQLLYVQCVLSTSVLKDIELVKTGMGHYELFVNALNDIIKLNESRSNMDLIIPGFSAFDMTVEQIYQNLVYGQDSYFYEAFDADEALSEEEINYLTNLRSDFLTMRETIYPDSHYHNMNGEEISRMLTEIVKKYQINSDIRTFSDKYRRN